MAETPLQLRMVLPRVPTKVKKLTLSVVTATVALSFWILTSRQTTPSTVVQPSRAVAEELMDARLQQIIKKTLGDREGTVIVIDPQTGRIRSVVNPELAYALQDEISARCFCCGLFASAGSRTAQPYRSNRLLVQLLLCQARGTTHRRSIRYHAC